MKKNNGKDYENFVTRLQQALIDSESLMKHQNVTVETNRKIIDNCGIKREFDLYWEYELAGVTYKTVIECKDYNSKIPLEKIDALIGKIRDIPDLRAAFATKIGYQSGAKKKAELNKIDLLVVRSQSDSDWKDKNGNSYLKEIAFNLDILLPATIKSFLPEIDGIWAKENTNLDLTNPPNMSLTTDQIRIEDIEMAEEYTLLQLEEKLGYSHLGKPGEFIKKQRFNDAYIYNDNLKLRLLGYEIRYSISLPQQLSFNIDYSKELIGVIEYLLKGTKTAVYSDKVIKSWR